jgi:hypothetical protein
MTLNVQSERWCEMYLPGIDKSNCTRCHEAALTVCEACGSAVCDAHEVVCGQCGRSYCSQCEHACVAGQPRRKAA